MFIDTTVCFPFFLFLFSYEPRPNGGEHRWVEDIGGEKQVIAILEDG
jgi:hypothetical protein